MSQFYLPLLRVLQDQRSQLSTCHLPCVYVCCVAESPFVLSDEALQSHVAPILFPLRSF